MSQMRLQRALARAGVASRRRAEELILAGKVRVNGKVAELGMRVDPARDVVIAAGRRVRLGETTWIALHKPIGCLVTRGDPKGRPTVYELLPDVPGLTYVGRLDYMTSGLLLLTTDGLGAQRLTHPRYAVPRTYVVRVRGEPTDAVARAFERSVTIDRRSVEVQSVSVRAAPRGATDVQMTLVEGRHRIVRRVCSELGLQVERLKRTRYGPVRVGRLPIRKWRALSNRERGAIDKLVYVNGN